jgi:Uma2 family endonuclease
MEEYRENGAQLGWLLDPATRRVYVYRPAANVEIVEDAASLSGGSLLLGFVLELSPIWAAVERRKS